jgi:O-antigen ligase
MNDRELHTPSKDSGAAIRTGMMAIAVIFLASIFVSIAVNSLSLGLMGILWLVLMIVQKRWTVVRTPLDWFFLAYLCAETLSTIFSLDVPLSVYNARRLLLIALVYFFASNIRSRKELQRFFWVVEGTAIAVALVGIVRTLEGIGDGTGRLGVFQFYMTTSGLMTCAALFLLPLTVHKNTPRRVRWMAVAGLLPLLVALYATVTRGAYLAFIAGALLVILVRDRRLITPLIVLIILSVWLAPPYIAGRIHSIIDPAHPENVTRLFIWTAGLRIFAHYPILGVGDIDLGDLLRQYADPGYPGLWGHMHNVILQLMVTLGAVGTVVVLAMFVRIAMVEWQTYRRLRDDWLYGSIALGALALFVGIMVHGLSEWNFGDQEIALFLWTSVGFTLAAARLSGGFGEELSARGASWHDSAS